MSAEAPARTRPTNWDAFIARVRETGKVQESAKAVLGSTTYYTYYTEDDELRTELETARQEGVLKAKADKVYAVLDIYKTGATLGEAVKQFGMSVSNFYLLAEATGLTETYEAIRDGWRNYKGSIPFLLEQLDIDGLSTDNDAAKAAIETLQTIVRLCDVPARELAANPTALRDAILREIGAEYEDEDGFPPFLRQEEE